MNKTVLITGCSSGIGKATVEVFLKNNWNVVATMRDPQKSPFKNLANVKSLKLDVTDSKSINQAFDQAIKEYSAINVVVNNAGYGVDGVFEAIDTGTIVKQFDTNVFGLMRVSRKAIEIMKPNGGGIIIQISSMGGRIAVPLYSIYHSTKWAVEGFSESLQYELEQFGIKIKVIEPGVIKTDFYGNSRVLVKASAKLGYDEFINKIDSVTQDTGNNGVDPIVVAETVYKASTSKSAKFRYVVGKPAPLLLFIRKLLPERIFFKIIKFSFKLE